MQRTQDQEKERNALEAKSTALYAAGTRIRALANSLSVEARMVLPYRSQTYFVPKVSDLKARLSAAEAARDSESVAAASARDAAMKADVDAAAALADADAARTLAEQRSAELESLSNRIACERTQNAVLMIKLQEAERRATRDALKHASAVDAIALEAALSAEEATWKRQRRRGQVENAVSGLQSGTESDVSTQLQALRSALSSSRFEVSALTARLEDAASASLVAAAQVHTGNSVERAAEAEVLRARAQAADANSRACSAEAAAAAALAAAETLRLELAAVARERSAAPFTASSSAAVSAAMASVHDELALAVAACAAAKAAQAATAKRVITAEARAEAESRRVSQLEAALGERQRSVDNTGGAHAAWERTVAELRTCHGSLLSETLRADRAEAKVTSVSGAVALARQQLTDAHAQLAVRDAALRGSLARERHSEVAARRSGDEARAAAASSERAGRLHADIVAALQSQLSRALSYAEERQDAIETLAQTVRAGQSWDTHDARATRKAIAERPTPRGDGWDPRDGVHGSSIDWQSTLRGAQIARPPTGVTRGSATARSLLAVSVRLKS